MARPRSTARSQLSLELPRRGGARPGAGRKPNGDRAGVSHRPRQKLTRHTPAHVSLRVLPHVWNLRSGRALRAIEAALEGALHAGDAFRVVHFSVEGNHLHLIVEADGNETLSTGMQGLTIRLAKGLNRMMGRRGKVFADRFHAHVLSTPAETRNALAYVLLNHRSHRARAGEQGGRGNLGTVPRSEPVRPSPVAARDRRQDGTAARTPSRRPQSRGES